MERGLLWLPLLVLFIGLAWAGWNEYRKVEAYRVWAEAFDQAKYDIYAVLGVKADELTWGVPTRNGPINLQTLSLKDVQRINVVVNDTPVNLDEPPLDAKKPILSIALQNDVICNIPFTEIDLAIQWAQFLRRKYSPVAP